MVATLNIKSVASVLKQLATNVEEQNYINVSLSISIPFLVSDKLSNVVTAIPQSVTTVATLYIVFKVECFQN